MLLVLAIWWAVETGATSDQHTQTLVALGILAFAVLGGLVHTVFRLGRLTQAVEDMTRRLTDLEKKVPRR